MTLMQEFKFNSQEAENLSTSEMISPILCATHKYCKKASISFKDINQNDKCYINEKETALLISQMSDRYDFYMQSLHSRGQNENTMLFVMYAKEKGEYVFVGWMDRETLLKVPTETHSSGSEYKKVFYHALKPISDLWKIEEEETKEETRDELQPFVHLHLHTEYSVGDGYGDAETSAMKLWKKGFNSAAITDHGTLAGTYYMQKTMKTKNMKPIIGCEAYMCDQKEDKDSGHITILVKNETGWKNLLKIHNEAVVNNFYYRPRITLEDLLKHKEGLVVMSGCISGYIAKWLKKVKDPDELIKLFKDNFGEDFYIEIMPHHEVPGQKEYNLQMLEYAKKYDIKMVITCDSHYPEKEDKKIHEAIKAINYNKKYGEAGFNGNTYYYLQHQEIRKLVNDHFPEFNEHLDTMFANTIEVSNKTNFEIQKLGYDTLPRLCIEDAMREEFEEWKKKNDVLLTAISEFKEV